MGAAAQPSQVVSMNQKKNAAGAAFSGVGGARRDRTADLLHAMQALSQLSYSPGCCGPEAGSRQQGGAVYGRL